MSNTSARNLTPGNQTYHYCTNLTLGVRHINLIPTDGEMLLSIAKLIEKLNDCSTGITDHRVLECVNGMA